MILIKHVAKKSSLNNSYHKTYKIYQKDIPTTERRKCNISTNDKKFEPINHTKTKASAYTF